MDLWGCNAKTRSRFPNLNIHGLEPEMAGQTLAGETVFGQKKVQIEMIKIALPQKVVKPLVSGEADCPFTLAEGEIQVSRV